MAKQKITTIKVENEKGEEIFKKTVKGLKNVRPLQLEALGVLKENNISGRMLQTQEGAEAWSVWDYQAGDAYAHRNGLVVKANKGE